MFGSDYELQSASGILTNCYESFQPISYRHLHHFPIHNYFSNYEGVSKSFRTESITKYTLTFGITRLEATQRLMAAKRTRLTHKIKI
jgi:hypothetical protein